MLDNDAGMRKELSQSELAEIERLIESIDSELDVLNPMDIFEAHKIEANKQILSRYIQLLEPVRPQRAQLHLVV